MCCVKGADLKIMVYLFEVRCKGNSKVRKISKVEGKTEDNYVNLNYIV
jgi:hypothetical protein